MMKPNAVRTLALLGASIIGGAASDTTTSRVPLIGDDTANPAIAKFYADVRSRGGEPLNLHRTMANAPELLKGSSAMAYSIRYGASVPRIYRELAIIRSVQLNGGHYEELQHRPMALSCGVSEAQLDAIAHWPESDVFDEKQRAVLAFADGVSATDGPSDAVFNAVKANFSDQEIVELAVIAATYAGTAMLTRALHTPAEPGAGAPQSAYGKC